MPFPYPEFELIIFAALFGVIIGSFLSVCIYRIPRAHAFYPEDDDPSPVSVSFLEPRRSICPKCGKQLKWWHNIPVVSWMLLGGKCAFCKTRISVRYPVVELLAAIIAAGTLHTFGPTITALVIFIYLCALLVICFIDYDYYIIPDVISINAIYISIGLIAINHFYHVFDEPIVSDLITGAWGAAAGAGFLYVVGDLYLRLRGREGLGLGDVKLLASTGILFGPECAVYTIFLGSFMGSIVGGLLVLLAGRKFSKEIPFGPYLVLGTVLYLFVGVENIAAIIAVVTDGIRSWL